MDGDVRYHLRASDVHLVRFFIVFFFYGSMLFHAFADGGSYMFDVYVACTPVQGAWSQVYMYTMLKGSVGLFGLFIMNRFLSFLFLWQIRNFIYCLWSLLVLCYRG